LMEKISNHPIRRSRSLFLKATVQGADQPQRPDFRTRAHRHYDGESGGSAM
jgi:hypothetical protein